MFVASGDRPIAEFADRRRDSGAAGARDTFGDAGPDLVREMLTEIGRDLVREMREAFAPAAASEFEPRDTRRRDALRGEAKPKTTTDYADAERIPRIRVGSAVTPQDALTNLPHQP